MDYRKNHQNSFAAPEVMSPDRAENIRNRLMNSGTAVPDVIEALCHQPAGEVEPQGRVHASRETSRLEKKALGKFRAMVQERLPDFGTGGFGESKSR